MPIDVAALVGKRLLVDIREYDSKQRLVKDLDFVGVVTRVEGTRATVQRDATGASVELDIDPIDLQIAKAEAYSLRGNRTLPIQRPDFVLYFLRMEEVAAPVGELGIIKPDMG
jgi:hypothetical protein